MRFAHYLSAHYLSMNLLLVFNAACLLAGGAWLWAGFVAAVLIATVVDEAAGDDRASRADAPVRLLDAMLFVTLPLVAFNLAVLVHLAAGGDPVGLGALLQRAGIDLDSARAASGPLSLAGGILGLGLFTGAAATNVAHELTHRLDRPLSMLAGRWLLAFSFDTSFSIEHVHGHHRHVGTERDPATARRGEYALAFAWRSLRDGNISAWRIERDRLMRKGLPAFSRHNRFLTGQAMSLTLVAVTFAIGGWPGVGILLATGLQGKLYLELVNYIEHYGLVRVPGQRIEARHSWNTYRIVSSGLLYNLPRHSHHHRNAMLPFWSLEVEPEGPVWPHGYLTMLLIALVPSLFERIARPLLAEWDRSQASPEERALLAQAGFPMPQLAGADRQSEMQ